MPTTTRWIFASTSDAGVELWITDGTAAGTVQLADIWPGSLSGDPSNFTPLPDGRVLFTATDPINGTELWITDGTASGTVLLSDIYAGGSSSSPSDFTVLGNGLVVFAADGGNGTELWVTDGTGAGTTLLADILPVGSSIPSAFTRLADGRALFVANSGPGNNRELWITDGTAAGTTLLKDINIGNTGSFPNAFTPLDDGRVLFIANDGGGGELWITDGSSAGTVRVKDILPGASSSGVQNLTPIGSGRALFTANDGTNGVELWITDGTDAGTAVLKNIHPTGASSPSQLTPLGDGRVIFRANDGTSGIELWVTDGTAAGTVLLRDILTGTASPDPQLLTSFGDGRALFVAAATSNGRELWVTDGTTGGTVLLADINPGTATSDPQQFTLLATGRIVFAATSAAGGRELWVTDGTAAGTLQLASIAPGAASSDPISITLLSDGRASFIAYDDVGGSRLWITDGTTSGTLPISTLAPSVGSDPQDITPLGSGRALLTATNQATGSELWVTDGTAAGTTLLADIAPGIDASNVSWLTPLPNGKTAFSADNGTTGSELWVTDGTAAGTTLLVEIFGGPSAQNGSGPTRFTPLPNGSVLFVANSNVIGQELWVTDGTVGGTHSVKDINPGGSSVSPAPLIPLGNGLVLFGASASSSQGTELWATDGTAAGTVLLKDINTGLNASSNPLNITALGDGRAVFTANDGVNGVELWVSDGTSAGTSPVAVLDPLTGPTHSYGSFTSLGNGRALFEVNDGVHGTELWVTDGSGAGTFLLNDIVPGTGSGSGSQYTPLGDGRVLFSANTPGVGVELWVTDGTTAGTALVKDINTSATAHGAPHNITPIGGGRALFAVNDGTTASALWITDGTSSGTVLVRDISLPAFGSGLSANITPLGDGRFVFTATDATSGTELWITDGTTAGTQLVKDINLGTASSTPQNFRALGNGLAAFSASDPIHGNELWITDGTSAGTHLVRDLNNASTLTSVALTPVVVQTNSAPTGSPTAALAGGTEDTPYTVLSTELLAGFTDADGDTLAVANLTADHGSLADNGDGNWTFTPEANYHGPVSLTYDVVDGNGGSTAATQSFSLAPVNDAPTLTSALVNHNAIQGQAFNFVVPAGTFADVDAGDTLNYSATLSNGAPLPSWLSFDSASRTFSGTPAAGDLGTLSIRVSAVDGSADQAFDDFALAVSAPPPAVTAGAESRVNTTTANAQFEPVVTGLAGGGYVVAWTSDLQDGAAGGTYFQRYDAAGHAVGAETRANTTTIGNQFQPAIDALADGGFVVSWTGFDASGFGILAQRFDANGQPMGAESVVPTTVAGNQFNPGVTGLADGGYVVSWASDGQDGDAFGIYTKKFDANGNAVSAETRANTTTAGSQEWPVVGALTDGGYVVAWHSGPLLAAANEIYFQRFSAAGALVGAEMRANTTTANNQELAAVTGLADGGWVVTWSSTLQDGSARGVYFQRYDAQGHAQGGETRANTFTGADQTLSTVAALGDGGFVIAWQSSFQDGSGTGIYAQRYDANGAAVGAETLVNVTTASDQADPSVAALAAGAFVVAWTGHNQDGSDRGVYARTFLTASPPVVSAPQADQSSNEDSLFSFAVPAGTFTDPNAGDTLSYSATLADGSALPGWLSFDAATRTLSGTPLQTDVGAIDIRITATDSGALSASDVFTLTVNNVNDNPTGTPTAVLTDGLEDTPYVVAVAALLTGFSDEDGDMLSVANVTADHGTVADDGDGTFTITPQANYNGPVALAYNVVDGHGGSAAATQSFSLAPVVDPNAAPALLDSPAPTYSIVGAGTVLVDIFEGSGEGNGAALQADGSLVIAARTWNGSHYDFAVVKLTSDGRVDTGFGGGDGKVVTDFAGRDDQARSIVVQPDGKIVIAGTVAGATNSDFAVARYNPNGTLDSTFGGGTGRVFTTFGAANDNGADVVLQADGKIIVVGSTNTGSGANSALVRYNANGTLDTTFGAGGRVTIDFGGTSDEVYAVEVLDGSKILVAGRAVVGSSNDFTLMRLNANGTLDTTFGGGDGKVATDFLGSIDIGSALIVQPDGKIVVAGSSYNATGASSDFGIARYNADGSVDTTFGAGTGRVRTGFSGTDDAATSIALQGDGKLVVGGSELSFTDGSHFALARYNADGSLDSSFGSGTGKVTTNLHGNSEGGRSVMVQPDGKIVVVGSAGNVFTNEVAVVRYNPDGTLDTGFGADLVERFAPPDLSATGTFSFDDADDGDTHTVSVAASAGNPLGGVLTAAVSTAAAGPGAGTVSWAYTVSSFLGTVQALAQGETSQETFDLTVTDGAGASTVKTVTVTVIGSNDVPIAAADAAVIMRNTSIVLPVRANDVDDHGAVLTVVSVTNSVNGNVTIDAATGNPRFTPTANFAGFGSFNYTVSDQFGATSSATVTITVASAIGTEGADLALNGNAAVDLILGLGGDDVITGGAGADILIGGPATLLPGQTDNDTFRVGGADLNGDDIRGGAGVDRLLFTSAVNLGAGFAIDQVEELDMAGFALNVNTAAPVNLSSMMLLGTGGPINGNAAANQIVGTRGADTINGGAGNDALAGSFGNDTLTGGAGSDVIFAGNDDDVIQVGGADLNGDATDGGTGIDTLRLTANASTTGFTMTNVEVLDMLGRTLTVQGATPLNLAALTLASPGTIAGDGAVNTITGTQGGDNITGAGGNDTLNGGLGDDLLTGGAGGDVLNGGDGADVFQVAGTELTGDSIDGGSGFDTLRLLANASTTGFTMTNVEVLDMLGRTLTVQGPTPLNLSDLSLASPGTIAGDGAANSITGTLGDDVISGGGGNDYISGSLGNDVVIGGAGADRLFGDFGTNIFRVSGGDLTGDQIYGGEGSLDYLQFNGNVTLGSANFSMIHVDILDMGGFSLTVQATTKVDLSQLLLVTSTGGAISGNGADNIILAPSGANTLSGGGGNDVLFGNFVSDTISGGLGNDTINGGFGNDLLQGNAGNDTFVFSTALDPDNNVDAIAGFAANGADKIALDPTVFAALTGGATTGVDASEFHVSAGGNAADADDFLLYDSATGSLYYDPDGSGAGAKLLFARLTGLVGTLDSSDFTTTPPGGV